MVAKDSKKAFSERLHQALDDSDVVKGRGRNAAVVMMFKSKFKISGEAARKWLGGISMPRTDRISVIAVRLGVNAEWLLSGHGPMRPSDPSDDELFSQLRADTGAPKDRVSRMAADMLDRLDPGIPNRESLQLMALNAMSAYIHDQLDPPQEVVTRMMQRLKKMGVMVEPDGPAKTTEHETTHRSPSHG